MKNLLLKVISLVLMVTFAASMCGTVSFAMEYPDEGYWANEAIDAAKSVGLLQGKDSEGNIYSEDYLTRAELATIMVRAFGASAKTDISKYYDIKSTDWFYDAFAKAVQMRVFEGDGTGSMRPNDNITREEVFTVVARALVLKDSNHSTLNKFNDSSKISSWAKDYMSIMAQKSYVNGDDSGNVNPQKNITRAEFAQLMYNIFKTNYISKSGTYSKETYNSSLMINDDNINLDGVVVKGDLIIGDGVDLSKISLKDVTIEGRLVVRGASEIKLTDTKVGEKVVVNNYNSVVHFDNYETEAVFENIAENTEATFKEKQPAAGGGGAGGGAGGGGGGGGVRTADYTIEYYLQNIENDNYVLYDSEVKSGKVGKLVTPPSGYKDKYRGFEVNTSNSTLSTTVLANDTAKLIVKYDRIKYTISFDTDGGIGTVTPFEAKYGQKIYLLLPTVTKDNFILKGWYDGTTLVDENYTVSDAVILKAEWEAIQAGNAMYQVQYYVQKADKSGYDAYGVPEQHQAQINSTVNADTTKVIDGYEFNSTYGGNVLSGEVLEDGSLVLKVYYDIKSYNYKVEYYREGLDGVYVIEDSENDVEVLSAVYGEAVSVTPVADKFVGFTYNSTHTGNVLSATVTDNTVVLKVYYSRNTYTYTIKYQYENANDDLYTENTEPLTGKYGEAVSVTPVAVTGFVTPGVVNGTIPADNSLVLTVTYDRETYTISFDTDGAGTITPITVKYGQTIDTVLPTLSKDGYTFKGWYDGTTLVDGSYTVSGPVTLKAEWEAIPVGSAMYQVQYYVQKADKSGYEVYGNAEQYSAAVGSIVYADTTKVISGYVFNSAYSGNVLSGEVLVNNSLVLKVYYDIVVTAETVEVTFYDGTAMVGSPVTLNKGTTFATSSEVMPATNIAYKGYVEDKYVSDIYAQGATPGEYTHKINFGWWYENALGEWVEFTDSVVVNEDMDVYVMSRKFVADIVVAATDKTPAIPLPLIEMFYEDDTRFADTLKDLLARYLPLNELESLWNNLKSQALAQKVIDSDDDIQIVEIPVKFSQILGDENVEEFIVDSAKESLGSNATLTGEIKGYFKTVLNSSDTVKKDEVKNLILEAVNKFIDSDAALKAVIKDIIVNETGYAPAAVDSLLATPSSERDAAILTMAEDLAKAEYEDEFNELIDYAMDYLNDHEDMRDDLIEDIIETMYRADLDKLVYELINNDRFELNDRIIFVAEGLKNTLITDYDYDVYVATKIPERLKKVFEIYPEIYVRTIYENAINDEIAQIDNAIAVANGGGIEYIDSGVTAKINPVDDVYIPLYDGLLGFINDKSVDAEWEEYYTGNPYLQELIKKLSWDNLFTKNGKSGTSGYKLKSFEDLNWLVNDISILGDDTLTWYYDNKPSKEAYDKVVERFQDIAVKYANVIADIMDAYVEDGTLPNSKLSPIESAIKNRFPAYVDKAVDWYKNSQLFNRVYSGDDYNKLRDKIYSSFELVNITTDEFFDKVLSDKVLNQDIIKDSVTYDPATGTYTFAKKNITIKFRREISRN